MNLPRGSENRVVINQLAFRRRWIKETGEIKELLLRTSSWPACFFPRSIRGGKRVAKRWLGFSLCSPTRSLCSTRRARDGGRGEEKGAPLPFLITRPSPRFSDTFKGGGKKKFD